MRYKAVFLDRDGVLNEAVIKNNKPYPPATLDALRIPDDVTESLHQLKKAGFLLIGATNQPDVARGTTDQSVVESINNKLMETLPLDEIRVCYHDDKDECQCRKPLPGLLLDAAKSYQIDLDQSFMIGDRWKDIEAGQRAGCKTIWIKQAYDEKEPTVAPDFIAKTLAEAVHWMIQNNLT